MGKKSLKTVALIAVTLATARAQTPVVVNVVNAANSYSPSAIAIDSWITITGMNLSATTRPWTSTDFQNGRLPLSLDGVSVTVDGLAVPVSYVSPTQINALVTADQNIGPVTVTVTNAAGASSRSSVPLSIYAPGLFKVPGTDRNLLAEHGDGTLVTSAAPAVPGEEIMLFGTGFGPTTPSVDQNLTYDGAAPLMPPNNLSVNMFSTDSFSWIISDTGTNLRAAVLFAGLIGNGLYQLNVVVPRTFDGVLPLGVQIGPSGMLDDGLLPIQGSPNRPLLAGAFSTQQLALLCTDLDCTPPPVTAAPGEQIDFWIAGQNLSSASGVQFVPPDGITVSQFQSSGSTLHATLSVSAGAAAGARGYFLTSPTGDSNQMVGLNVATLTH